MTEEEQHNYNATTLGHAECELERALVRIKELEQRVNELMIALNSADHPQSSKDHGMILGRTTGHNNKQKESTV